MQSCATSCRSGHLGAESFGRFPLLGDPPLSIGPAIPDSMSELEGGRPVVAVSPLVDRLLGNPQKLCELVNSHEVIWHEKNVVRLFGLQDSRDSCAPLLPYPSSVNVSFGQRKRRDLPNAVRPDNP